MSRPVITLTADETIEAAATKLGTHGFHGAPVVDADGQLVGLLDDSDLLLSDVRLHAPTTVQLEEDVRRTLAQTVGEVMETDPPALAPDATVEARRVVGTVTRGDLILAMYRR